MRDPERVERMTEILLAYWRCYPDLRLGQIVENAKYAAEAAGHPTFSVEDDVIERGLRLMLRQ